MYLIPIYKFNLKIKISDLKNYFDINDEFNLYGKGISQEDLSYIGLIYQLYDFYEYIQKQYT